METESRKSKRLAAKKMVEELKAQGMDEAAAIDLVNERLEVLPGLDSPKRTIQKSRKDLWYIGAAVLSLLIIPLLMKVLLFGPSCCHG
ncbi:unnamed protein product [Nezara viridula]|uniref:Uncharacterized protein n=1 Tax=Nezara viridula TaxID=85310 RepID=A0A9P0MW94_NEZVI|nr:unnamed protein product [Nezara viridula]